MAATPLPNCLTGFLSTLRADIPACSHNSRPETSSSPTGMPLDSSLPTERPLFHSDNIRHQGSHSQGGCETLLWLEYLALISAALSSVHPRHILTLRLSRSLRLTDPTHVNMSSRTHPSECRCVCTHKLYRAPINYLWWEAHLRQAHLRQLVLN